MGNLWTTRFRQLVHWSGYFLWICIKLSFIISNVDYLGTLIYWLSAKPYEGPLKSKRQNKILEKFLTRLYKSMICIRFSSIISNFDCLGSPIYRSYDWPYKGIVKCKDKKISDKLLMNQSINDKKYKFQMFQENRKISQ